MENIISLFVLFILLFMAIGFILFLHRRNCRLIRLNKKLQAIVDKLKVENSREVEGSSDEERPDDFKQRVVMAINENMATGQTDVSSIASSMGLTPSKFRQELAKITDESAANYILRVRMERAVYLLKTRRSLSIQEVANLCGYSETSNFTRTFKKYTGYTPSSFLLPASQK